MNILQLNVNVLALMQLVSQHTLWKIGFTSAQAILSIWLSHNQILCEVKKNYFSNNINTVCVTKWYSFSLVFPIYFELLMTYDTLLLLSALSSHFDNFAIILGLHQGMTTFRPTSWNLTSGHKWLICHAPSYKFPSDFMHYLCKKSWYMALGFLFTSNRE